MNNNLILDIYPKNAEVACMVFRSDTDFFRENHLFNFHKVVDQLEAISIEMALGLPIMEYVVMRDKKNQEYAMVCAFSQAYASLTLIKKINQKKKNFAFCWKGTVIAFINAVNELLRKLGRRSS